MNARVSLFVAAAASIAAIAPAQTVVLDPMIVTATRAADPASQIPVSVRVVDANELARTPALTLDGALRSVPGFSLFRRSDSLTAHPTTQGVSLRGLGPSGASRTLVLLDGVPANDPFGGWIAWSALPRLSLDRVEIVRGAGATAWGNAALGGVLHLVSRAPEPGAARVQLSGGSRSLASAEFVAAQQGPVGVIEVAGRGFSSGGFEVVAPGNRGPIDTPAWQRHRWVRARFVANADRDTAVIATVRMFRERRGNGTPLQENGTREASGSVVVAHAPASGLRWTATAFFQDQEFSSTFSSVNAARDAETPASNQFAVPAQSWGVAWTATVDSAHGATTVGIDFRSVDGETREDSTFASGAFTRRRIAGGAQRIGGVFVLHSMELMRALRLTGGLRADRWEDADGFRREWIIASGTTTRDDRYANRGGSELSPSVGLVWEATEDIRMRASAQRAFRRPTLNELYRPFRVGAFITEANPELRTETVDGVDVGAEWGRGSVRVAATAFRHELRDAVANVTVVRGPGTFPDFGFIPAGGAGRRRFNLDRVVVQGVELSARLALGDAVMLTAEYLGSDARVRDGGADQALDGKRLAQVPRHAATLSLEWRGPAGVKIAPRLRMFSRQFEDDENALTLASAAVVDLAVSVPLRSAVELFVVAENLDDARVETGRTAAGVVSTGTPRTFVAGLRATF